MAVTKKRSFDRWFGTAAEKAGFTSMALGDEYFETDTQLLFEYTGTAWVTSSIDNLTLSAGTNLIGKVSIDQATANANEVVTKTGSVTNATLQAETTKVIGTVNNKIADGDNVTLGAKADAPATTGTTDPWSAIALLKGIYNKLGAVVLATGSAIIGRVGIDQTTPGTTNGVEINAELPAGTQNIGDVDINTLPAGNLGQRASVASLSIAPATDVADATYIGDIKFGEELPAGTQVIGQVSINQTTDETTNKVRADGVTKDTYAVTALAASGVIKASAGKLYGLAGVNDSSSDQYLQIFDSATVPADTTVPDLVLFIPAKSNFSFDLGNYGYALATGISWSNSSTLATKTIGSADVWLNGIYI